MGYPVESIPEVMRRTKSNLEFIQREREKRIRAGMDVDYQGPFEVTQLINSFMGAFAHPFEALFKLQDPPQSVGNDLKVLEEVLSRDAWYLADNPPSLEDTLRYVRNAFAHGNIEFIGGVVEDPKSRPHRDIVAIRIWNCRPRGKAGDGWQPQVKTWEKELTVSELEKVLLAFIDAMSRVDPQLFERVTDCPPQPKEDQKKAPANANSN